MAVVNYPRVLSWNDFGTPVDKIPAWYTETHTDCHIEIDVKLSYGIAYPAKKDGEYKLKNIIVTVAMNRLRCWVLKSVSKSPDQAKILNHEQGHYNIAGICAQQIERSVADLANVDQQKLKDEVEKTKDFLIGLCKTTQETYDGPTASGGADHGNDADGQSRWDSKIAHANSLQEL